MKWNRTGLLFLLEKKFVIVLFSSSYSDIKLNDSITLEIKRANNSLNRFLNKFFESFLNENNLFCFTTLKLLNIRYLRYTYMHELKLNLSLRFDETLYLRSVPIYSSVQRIVLQARALIRTSLSYFVTRL